MRDRFITKPFGSNLFPFNYHPRAAAAHLCGSEAGDMICVMLGMLLSVCLARSRQSKCRKALLCCDELPITELVEIRCFVGDIFGVAELLIVRKLRGRFVEST